jgi:hypothetical protein
MLLSQQRPTPTRVKRIELALVAGQLAVIDRNEQLCCGASYTLVEASQ